MFSSPRLVLGSSSVYRKNILNEAALQFITASPLFDEDQFKSTHGPLGPKELCEALALEKALSLKTTFKDDLILGCDQLVELEGEILGKSHNFDKAFSQLKKMSGKTHRLFTSSALIAPGGKFKVLTTTTEVTFRGLKDSEIKKYIEIERPFDCAGSYKMEKAGLFLAENIYGPDPMAIQGLSLIDLGKALRELGFNYEQFWKGPL